MFPRTYHRPRPARHIAAAVLLTSSFFACTKQPSGPAPAPMPSFQKGMTLACWEPACLEGPRADAALRQIADLGCNAITVVVTGYQSNETANRISKSSRRTATDAAVRSLIRNAVTAGFRVTLKPHVDLNNGEWRGRIAPSDRAAWYASYTDFILNYARLAEESGAAQFSVGTELASLSRDESTWRDIIAAVRNVYTGKLIYAASWNEFEHIAFWNALDYAGIDAYFPLTSLDAPSQVDLLAGWAYWLQRVSRWQERTGVEVLFSEVGYMSRDGANRRPFDFERRTTIDLQEQADCYEAALRSFRDEDWLHGAHWWYWHPDTTANHIGDYPVFGKPAATVLKAAWGDGI